MDPNASSSFRPGYIFENVALSGNARAVFGNVYISSAGLTTHFTPEEEFGYDGEILEAKEDSVH